MNVAAILKDKGEGVFTMRPENTLLEVATELASRKIGSVVVTEMGGSIAGIISERDVVRVLAERGPEQLSAPVEQAMTKSVVTCTLSDTIDELMAEMTARRFRHLPVVDDGQLIGIVSIGDVVKQRIAEAEMEAEAMRAYIATG
ncbi:MAG: CBS domain-containing protein [Hyphomicrobiaceae bacterium]